MTRGLRADWEKETRRRRSTGSDEDYCQGEMMVIRKRQRWGEEGFWEKD